MFEAKGTKMVDTQFDAVASKGKRNKILYTYNFAERYCPGKSEKFFIRVFTRDNPHSGDFA